MNNKTITITVSFTTEESTLHEGWSVMNAANFALVHQGKLYRVSQPELADVVTRALEPSQPKCAVCGNPATCIGAYEDAEEDSAQEVDRELAAMIADKVRTLPAAGGSIYWMHHGDPDADEQQAAACALLLELASERGFAVIKDRRATGGEERFDLRPLPNPKPPLSREDLNRIVREARELHTRDHATAHGPAEELQERMLWAQLAKLNLVSNKQEPPP